MGEVVEVYKQYKYRMYRCDKKDRALRHKIFVASTIWNHFVGLQRRYYNLSGKYISLYQMRKHVLKLRRTERFCLWMDLHSQVCQEVVLRVDDAYMRFFKGLAQGRPKFRKAAKYSSFTFPQSGYKLNGNTVMIDGVPRAFECGERIHSENSYKYSREEFAEMLRRAGFDEVQVWTDIDRAFWVMYAS